MTTLAEAPADIDTFVADSGATVRRISTSSIAVTNFGDDPRYPMIYLLPTQQFRSRFDEPEAWESQASKEPSAPGTRARFLAVAEYIKTRES